MELYVNSGGVLSEKYWDAASRQWIGWNSLP